MHDHSHLLSFVLLLPVLAAQGPPVPAGAKTPALGPSPFLSPLREVAADGAIGGGRWASGADYKARFDDGVAFYPVLGKAAPRNLPLRWRTQSIAVGGTPILGPLAQAAPHATDWRYELRWGPVTEAYDVRDDGVEQTFVLHQRPHASGDLVVVGAIESDLRAMPANWRHGELTFTDADGKPRVRYGAAFAIDANGRRAPMATRWDGRNIGLRLAAQWLAAAAYPVVVDPLLAPVVLATGSQYATGLDIARDDAANDLLVVYRRASSASDDDAFARVIADDLSGLSATIWTDIEASWSTEAVAAAFVGGSAKWIIALERRFPSQANYSWIRYHLHASGDHTQNNDVVFVDKPAAETWTDPDVGGTTAFSTGSKALLVFKAENPGAAPFYGDALAILVDTAAATHGAPILLAGSPAGTTFDRGGVRVNKQSAGGSTSWVVVFGEYNRAAGNDDWDVAVVRVTPAGARTTRSYVPDPSTDHKLRPVIDGRDGRYLIVYGVANPGHILTWMHSLRARRLDFADGATSPIFRHERLLRSAGEYAATDVAYDTRTDSHWTAVYYTSAWDSFAVRLGYDLGTHEAVTLYSGTASSSSPAVCFDDDDGEYRIAYPTSEGGYPVYVRTLAYPATSLTTAGTGCGGVIGAGGLPHAGTESFTVIGTAFAANTPAVLLGATASADIPLDGIGMPGCRLLLAPPALLFSLATNATAGGTATLAMALPTAAAGLDLHFQWAHVALGANPANLRATQRLTAPIR